MRDTVTVTMASIPVRERGMLTVVDQLLPQCDRLYVCLNDYAVVPARLNDPKIVYKQFMGKEQISDHGKFYWNDQIDGYHFTVDDDILYPKNYVEHTIGQIEHYRRKAVVGYHGTLLLLVNHGRLMISNKVALQRLRFGDTLPANRQVYMLGTGVLAYHTQTMRYMYRWLKHGGTDEQVSLFCQQHGIPMVCLAHNEGWLIDNTPMSCKQNIGGNKVLDGLAFSRVLGYQEWKLHTI